VTQAIILAGGAGTRLRAVVSDVPKPLAPVRGRPFLSYLMDAMLQQGVEAIVLSVGYRADQIVAAFGQSYRGVPIRYAVEDQPLGTGGGLRKALALIDAYPVLAMNGDSYLGLDLTRMRQAHAESGAGMTMALRRMADTGRYGRVVVEDGRVVGFAPRGAGPGLINGGLYLFARDPLLGRDLPPAFSFEGDFLANEVATLRPLAFETDGFFIDIGVPEDYARAQAELPDP
jgi:D-glycero-alpha-D-manno-heptose 1-phosphate guanylyltransferase